MTTDDEIKNLGTILGLWAHPDDETFMMGGLMSMVSAFGQSVSCITATRGEAGSQDEQKWPTSTLGEVRSKELEDALSILGKIEHHWLTYEDGLCHQISDSEAIKDLIPLVKKIRPDTIVTFPPDGITGHFDHQAVSRWSRMVARECDWPVRVLFAVDTQEQYDNFIKTADEQFNIYFNVDTPTLVPESSSDLAIHLSDEAVNRKVQSLHAMPSQTAAMFDDKGDEWFARVFCCETFVDSTRRDIEWNTRFKETP
jgi:LmbE family N-acetylglucosaminyl deacetylase